MFSIDWHHKRVLFLAISVVAGACGCHGLPGRSANTGTISSKVPPLTATPTAGVADSHLAAAPVQLADGAAAATAPLFVPPVPDVPGSAPAVLASHTHPQPVQQVASRPVPATQAASAPRMVSQADCLPPEAEWRKEMEHRTEALLKRLTQMEGELTSTKSSLNAVNQELKASNEKIEVLNRDVARWKGEFQRLEGEMKAQQLADLKSLDELTETMHQILLKQRAGASSTMEPVR